MTVHCGMSTNSEAKENLGRLSGVRFLIFERLSLHGLAIIVGCELKHLSLRRLIAKCQSLKSAFFSARAVPHARRNKVLVVRWQCAAPDELIAPQALG